MWFRWFLYVLAAIVFGIAAWLSTHVSSDPIVIGRYSKPYAAMLLGFLVLGLTLVLLAGPWFQSIRKFGGNVALMMAATAVCILLVELTVRISDPFGISLYEATLRYHLSKVPDDDLYFRHPYNADVAFHGVRVRTNSIGMRDRPLTEHREGVRRILFLGDSVTFGVGVDEDQVYTRQVERILNEDPGIQVQTFNSGVGGYNTDMEAAFLLRHGDLIKPDMVVMLWVGNDTEVTPNETFDPWSDVSIDGKSPPQVVRRLTWKSWTVRLVRHFATYWNAFGPNRLDTEQQGWIESVASVKKVNQWCKARGIPYFLVVMRYQPGGFLDDVVENFQTISEQQDIYFADSAPWWKDREILEYTNSVVDSHPNALGHDILADGISNLLLMHNLLSQ